ncbi:hypothetical protein C1H46_030886 [Malus baccata]|uniref:Uncharacterized protein n=1 Tax=Malus baccata TaxID=106549 RepID=A0A540LB52_MALBA|nr:hypothetical protein C1H46_030886 [Malus baccata]
MDELLVTKKNTRGPCRQLKTAKITRVTNRRITLGYDEQHRVALTTKQHSTLAHDIGHVLLTYCPMQWKSWKVMPDEMRNKTNYNSEDINNDMLAYVNRLFSERYKQWNSDLHNILRLMKIHRLVLRRVARRSLRVGRIIRRGFAVIFRSPAIRRRKPTRAIGNKKTFLHHSGSRPFSYRMEARRRGGSKFPEIDVFSDVYVQPGDELPESFHATMMEKRQLVLQESASQLPPDTPLEYVDPQQDAGFQIVTETLDQILRRRSGTYCRGMRNARRREPRVPSSS